MVHEQRSFFPVNGTVGSLMKEIKTQAFVVDKAKADFRLRTVIYDEVRDDEYLIEMKYSGICHTDIVLQQGLLERVCEYPAIFGHEGAGIVYSDKKSAARLEDGTSVGSMYFGHSSFSRLSVVKNQCVVKYPGTDIENMGLYAAAGCGFQTGVGSILNILKPEEHDSVVVFGLGGMGLAALMAAKYLNFHQIIAVDIQQSKLELARELGATHLINSPEVDPVKEIKKITGGGAAYAIECTGVVKCLEAAIECLRPLGIAGSIGVPPPGVKLSINPLTFLLESKKYHGLIEGRFCAGRGVKCILIIDVLRG